MSRRAKPRQRIVAESPVMRSVVAAAEELADSDVAVLVYGEPGTGRELIARLVHVAGGRTECEIVTACARAAISLVTGSGEQPRCEPFGCPCSGSSAMNFGGALLIRELGEMPKADQHSLERLLAGSGPAGGTSRRTARVVATGDPDIRRAVDVGVFDRNLYAQLRLIEVPALRDHREDIAPLAEVFIRRYARALGRGRMAVSSRTYERLALYAWPGNVAELQVVARRMVLRATTSRIDAGDVDAVLPVLAERVPLEEMSFEDMVRSKISGFLRSMEGYPIRELYEEVLSRVERPLLEQVMEHTGGNQMRAAEILGLNRNTLRRKLSERGLRVQHRGRDRGSPS